jgi:hypothetical protein
MCDIFFRKKRSRVNFTNVLQAAFLCTDSKSAKIHWWLDYGYLFAHLESSHVKALSKYVGEIDPSFRLFIIKSMLPVFLVKSHINQSNSWSNLTFFLDCTTPFEVYVYADAKADIAAANTAYSRGIFQNTSILLKKSHDPMVEKHCSCNANLPYLLTSLKEHSHHSQYSYVAN